MVSSIFITDIRTKMHMNVLHESVYHLHCARMLTSDFLMTSGDTLQVLACNPNVFFFICCIYLQCQPFCRLGELAVVCLAVVNMSISGYHPGPVLV